MRILAAASLCLVLTACSTSESPSAGAGSSRDAHPLAARLAAAPTTPNGAEIFNKTCATCHMIDGGGVPFLQPSIKGSGWISAEDPQLLLSLILRGSKILGEGALAYDNDMAPQDHLTDAEIAAVATYVRGRFASTPITKPVTAAEVAVARRRPGLPE